MSITAFGIIWTIIVLYYFCRKNLANFAMLVLYSCVWNYSAVIRVGGDGVRPFVWASLFFIIKFLILTRRGRTVERGDTRIALYLIAFFAWALIITLIGTYVFKGLEILKSSENLSVITQTYDGTFGYYRFISLFISCAVVICITKISGEIGPLRLCKTLKNMAVTVAIVGAWQYLTVSEILPNIDILTKFIYSYTPNNYLAGYVTNVGYARLMATFSEPSYCGSFISSIFWCLLCSNGGEFKNQRNKVVLLVVLLVEIILTKSSTAYCVFILGVLSLLFKKRGSMRVSTFVTLTIIIVGAIIFGMANTELLDQVLFKKLEGGSAFTRGQWNTWALKTFENTHWLGLGYDSIRASSLVYNLLGNVGIVGTVLMICIIGRILKFTWRLRDNWFSYIAFVYVALVIWGQCIACPDMHDPNLWSIIIVGVIAAFGLKEYKGKPYLELESGDKQYEYFI